MLVIVTIEVANKKTNNTVSYWLRMKKKIKMTLMSETRTCMANLLCYICSDVREIPHGQEAVKT